MATEGSGQRQLPGTFRGICRFLSMVGIAAAIYFIFHLSIADQPLMDIAYYYLVLALFATPVFLLYPLKKGAARGRIPLYDLALASLFFASNLYLAWHAKEMYNLGWESRPPLVPAIAAGVVWLLVLEACRRTVGLVFTVIVVVLSTYPFFADHMPGLFQAKAYSVLRVIGYQIMGPDGLIGIPMHVVAEIVLGYLIFGIVVQITGGGRFFYNLALGLLGRTRGGTAKVAIVASAFFGSISGSAVSNAVSVGSMTVPAMKRTGYPGHYAAAIETCASTGGVLMPPIMGAVAFVMASFMGISYAEVAIAAIVPSVLYYLSLFVQVDAYAAKAKLGKAIEAPPPIGQTLKEGWFLILGFLVLIYYVFYMRQVNQAPFYASVALILLAMIGKKTRLKLSAFGEFADRNIDIMANVVPSLGGTGLFMGGLIITGAAHGFSRGIIDLAGGNIALLLIAGAIASFVLGLGLAVVACYIFVAMLLAPALIQSGLNPLASHMFILYCGMLSEITPPVAPPAFVLAPIAQAPVMKVQVYAMRLGLVLFILPFFFVLNPALILQGQVLEIVRVIPMAILGVWLLASSIEGYLVRVGTLSVKMRVPLFAAGILFIIPNWYTDIAGIALAGAIIGTHLLHKRLLAAKSSPVGVSEVEKTRH